MQRHRNRIRQPGCLALDTGNAQCRRVPVEWILVHVAVVQIHREGRRVHRLVCAIQQITHGRVIDKMVISRSGEVARLPRNTGAGTNSSRRFADCRAASTESVSMLIWRDAARAAAFGKLECRLDRRA